MPHERRHQAARQPVVLRHGQEGRHVRDPRRPGLVGSQRPHLRCPHPRRARPLTARRRLRPAPRPFLVTGADAPEGRFPPATYGVLVKLVIKNIIKR